MKLVDTLVNQNHIRRILPKAGAYIYVRPDRSLTIEFNHISTQPFILCTVYNICVLTHRDILLTSLSSCGFMSTNFFFFIILLLGTVIGKIMDMY